eukprot:gene20231-biopygen22096
MRKEEEDARSRAKHPRASHAATLCLDPLSYPHRRLHAASEPILFPNLGDRLRLTVRTGARERDLPWIFQAQPQDTLLHERRSSLRCRFISLQPGCGMFTHSLSANP